MSSAQEQPAELVGPVVTAALTNLLPDELSLELFNSQYLQRHSTDARAILASAKVSRLLNAPKDEVESAVFAALNPDVQLDIKASVYFRLLFKGTVLTDTSLQTAQNVLVFLNDIGSSRADEFRQACDGKFALSTVFKLPSETAGLRWSALPPDEPMSAGEADKAEVMS